MDIDLFKKVNDSYGHIIGDSVLVQLSSLISDNLRVTDTFGRWGGEEFLALCPHLTCAQARLLGEKLRSLIELNQFKPVGKVTASFGITCYMKGDEAIDMLNRADRALYKAKEMGRNRVEE